MTVIDFMTRPFFKKRDCKQAILPSEIESDILKRVYTIEYTKERQKDRVIHKCRHCIHCRGIPSHQGNTYQKIREKVSNAMLSSRADSQKQKHDILDLPQEDYLALRIRRGAIPETRWRKEESLGSSKSMVLSKRNMSPIQSLKLPERCTNISSARIDVPSDAYMERYSFSMRSFKDKDGMSPPQDIIARTEVTCQSGRYLETVQRQSKSKIAKTSPQSVLAEHSIHINSSSSESGSSLCNQEDHIHSAESFDYSVHKSKSGRRSHRKNGKLTTLERLNMFLQSCVMSPDALYETVNEI